MSAPLNLERLVSDVGLGHIRGAEIILDRAHNDRPNHVDLHVFMPDGPGRKYTNLTYNPLDLPGMVPGSHRTIGKL